MWEVLLLVIIAIILIVVLFKFGLSQKRKDLIQLEKHFNPRHD